MRKKMAKFRLIFSAIKIISVYIISVALEACTLHVSRFNSKHHVSVEH